MMWDEFDENSEPPTWKENLLAGSVLVVFLVGFVLSLVLLPH